MKRLKNYNSAHQLGALNIMIQCLNIGLPLENLVHICCFDKNGPMFKHDDFTEALCSTWVFIDPKARGYMDPIKTPEDQPDSVESQIGNIFLDMGFMGRHTRRFIPKDEVLEVLKERFQDAEIEGIVNTEFQEIVETLDMAGDELKKLEEEYAVNVNKNEMDTFDELLRWDDTFIISEEIMKVILAIKGSVDKILSRKDSQLIQMIEEIDSKDQLIYLLSKLVQEHHNLVLTRAAWDWIENEDRNVIKRMIAMMLLKTGNNVEIRKLFKAMLENKSLFYKYMK
jgi:hypothetical protein